MSSATVKQGPRRRAHGLAGRIRAERTTPVTAVVPTTPATPLERPGIDALSRADGDGGGDGGGGGGGGDSSSSDDANEGLTFAERLASLSAAASEAPTGGGDGALAAGTLRQGDREGTPEDVATAVAAVVAAAATSAGRDEAAPAATTAFADGDAATRGAVGTLAGALEQALRTSDSALFEKVLNATIAHGSVTPAATTAALPPGVATAALLPALVARLTDRPTRTDTLLPWVSAILVGHAATLLAAGPDSVSGRAVGALAAAFGARARGRAALVGLGGRLELLAARAAAVDAAKAASRRTVVSGRGQDVPLVRFDVEEAVAGGSPVDKDGGESGEEEGAGAAAGPVAVMPVADAADDNDDEDDDKDDGDDAGESSSDAEESESSEAEPMGEGESNSEGDGSGDSAIDGSAGSGDADGLSTADVGGGAPAARVASGIMADKAAAAASRVAGGSGSTTDAAMDVSG
ncbi:hypothetical protein MMPV_007373 [Pyropia vietnamensis]